MQKWIVSFYKTKTRQVVVTDARSEEHAISIAKDHINDDTWKYDDVPGVLSYTPAASVTQVQD